MDKNLAIAITLETALFLFIVFAILWDKMDGDAALARLKKWVKAATTPPPTPIHARWKIRRHRSGGFSISIRGSRPDGLDPISLGAGVMRENWGARIVSEGEGLFPSPEAVEKAIHRLLDQARDEVRRLSNSAALAEFGEVRVKEIRTHAAGINPVDCVGGAHLILENGVEVSGFSGLGQGGVEEAIARAQSAIGLPLRKVLGSSSPLEDDEPSRAEDVARYGVDCMGDPNIPLYERIKRSIKRGDYRAIPMEELKADIKELRDRFKRRAFNFEEEANAASERLSFLEAELEFRKSAA